MFGQAVVVTLPSTDKVRAKKPSMVTMFTSGLFPNDVTTYAIRLYNKQVSEQSPSQLSETDPEAAKTMLKLIDIFVPKILIEPRVVEGEGAVTAVEVGEDGVQKGTVKLEDIPDPDKQYLFLWGQGLLPDDANRIPARAEAPPAAAEVAPFRGGDERPDAGPTSAEVSPAAVEPAGNPV